MPDRDPVSWTFSASVDCVTYYLMDTRTNYATTLTRMVYMPAFALPSAIPTSPPTLAPSQSPTPTPTAVTSQPTTSPTVAVTMAPTGR